ncbi:MAG: hypothetical protein EA408_12030 [Marinilabiliales bacterium]|nr:MAG: hypothetical protein EA408_12030 [Marinilabiliales bacterium]
MNRSILFSLVMLAIPYNLQPAVMHSGDIPSVRALIAGESYDEALSIIYSMQKTDYNDKDLWYLGGIAHNRMMRQDSALYYLTRAQGLDSTDRQIAGALASVYASLRQSARAREIYAEMIRQDSTLLMPYIQMAAIHMRDNEPRAALEIYLQLHAMEPGNPGFVKSIADCYRRSGNELQAVRYYRRAHSMNNSDLSINLALASLFARMKDFQGGLDIAEAGLSVDGSHAELLFWSGFFNYALGRYSSAIIRLNQAEENGNESIMVYQYLGISHYLMKNYEKARDYLEQVITANVNDHRLYTYLGRIYMQLKDYEISEIYFLNALEVLKPDTKSIIDTYLNLVDSYRLEGSWEKMADAYNSAMHHDGNNPYLHYGLAYTFDNHLDRHDDALEFYSMFIEIVSAFADPGNELLSLMDYAQARVKRIREEQFFQ